MSDGVSQSAPAQRAFDGIICIGGSDWWYHNRGHFDFQIMRRLARELPVLYVNSLGVRMPSMKHDGQFGARIKRKLKSFGRGLVTVENKFSVFSPAMVPGALGMKVSSWALAPQIRLAARRAGIHKPLLWVHCPAGASLIDDLGAVALVFQRTDRFEAFLEGDSQLIAGQIAKLKATADLVIYAAKHLQQEEANEVAHSLLVTHGVDFDSFVAAGKAKPRDPIDLVTIPRPRIGFIGGIDAHTFDPALFLAAAEEVKEANFVMCGGCSLPEGWCTHPNVKFIGRKPYEEVARIMAACDVLIMPWNDSEWIKACNPIKLKEYLAVGRPIVTRDFRALDDVRDLVRVANTPAAFSAAIRAALHEPYDPEPGRRRIGSESWDAKADAVLSGIQSLQFARSRRGKSKAAVKQRPLTVSQTAHIASSPTTESIQPAIANTQSPAADASQEAGEQAPLRLTVRPKPKRARKAAIGPVSQLATLTANASPAPAPELEPIAEKVVAAPQEPEAGTRVLTSAAECFHDHGRDPSRPGSPTKLEAKVSATPQQIKREKLNALVESARQGVTKKRWYQLGGNPAHAGSRKRG